MPSRQSSAKKTAPSRQETFRKALAAYEKAMKIFVGKGDPGKARDAFRAFLDQWENERAALELVDRARLHLAACEARLAPPPPPPEGPEELLLAAVVAVNEGDRERAEELLDKAEAAGAPAARVAWLRASLHARAGRDVEALSQLRIALDEDPELRFLVLQVDEFRILREMEGFAELIEPPGKKKEEDGGTDGEDS